MQKPIYYLRKYPTLSSTSAAFMDEFTEDYKASGVALSVAQAKLRAITNKVPYHLKWNSITKHTENGSRARLTTAISVLNNYNMMVDLIQFDEVTILDFPKHQYSALIELDGRQFWVSLKYISLSRNNVVFTQDMKGIKQGTTATLIAARNHVKVLTKGQEVWVHKNALEVEYDLHEGLWKEFLAKIA